MNQLRHWEVAPVTGRRNYYMVSQRPGDTQVAEDPIIVRGRGEADHIARTINLAYQAGYIDSITLQRTGND